MRYLRLALSALLLFTIILLGVARSPLFFQDSLDFKVKALYTSWANQDAVGVWKLLNPEIKKELYTADYVSIVDVFFIKNKLTGFKIKKIESVGDNIRNVEVDIVFSTNVEPDKFIEQTDTTRWILNKEDDQWYLDGLVFNKEEEPRPQEPNTEEEH